MNYSELNAEMGRKGMSIPQLAKKLNLSPKALYSRFKGKSAFKQNEIVVIAAELNLSNERIMEIFFANKVS